MVFHEITTRRDRARARRDARDRRAARRRAGDAPHPRPALRLRGLAGALEEGDAAASRPAACSRSRRGSSSSASASGWRSSPPSTGTSSARSTPAAFDGAPRRASTASASPRAATSARDGDAPRRRRSCSSTRRRARGLAERLDGAAVRRPLASSEKPYTRRPAPPFMTSTLQQEASRKLRFAAQTTMRVAQRLYENGYITYMRTDSTTLSETALAAARDQARELYGAESVPDEPRRYDRKVKNAQEAHEAIRPAGDRFRTPDEVRGELDARRARALRADLEAHRRLADGGRARRDRLGAARRRRVRRARTPSSATAGTVITFRGFLPPTRRAATSATPTTTRSAGCRSSPRATRSTATELEPEGHATTPPPRYTEATLVQALEERGIGRPSTYASIIGTILDRGYVFKKGTALVPSFLAFAVVQLLEQHFAPARRLRLHGADGGRPRRDRRRRRGAHRRGSAASTSATTATTAACKTLVDRAPRRDRRARGQLDRDPATDIVVRVGRYGPYLERGERRGRRCPTTSRPTS